jgi:hypothetical protein
MLLVVALYVCYGTMKEMSVLILPHPISVGYIQGKVHIEGLYMV